MISVLHSKSRSLNLYGSEGTPMRDKQLVHCILKRLLKTLTAVVFFVSVVAAAEEPINTLEEGFFFGYSPSGTAIRGYDTVAYFITGKATPGSEDHTWEWQGATWRFASQAHQELFANNPEQYAPQFGGYCAYGVAFGDLLKIEGDQWEIVDGKLYLNFSSEWMVKWRANQDELITMAEDIYPMLIQE